MRILSARLECDTHLINFVGGPRLGALQTDSTFYPLSLSGDHSLITCIKGSMYLILDISVGRGGEIPILACVFGTRRSWKRLARVGKIETRAFDWPRRSDVPGRGKKERGRYFLGTGHKRQNHLRSRL